MRGTEPGSHATRWTLPLPVRRHAVGFAQITHGFKVRFQYNRVFVFTGALRRLGWFCCAARHGHDGLHQLGPRLHAAKPRQDRRAYRFAGPYVAAAQRRAEQLTRYARNQSNVYVHGHYITTLFHEITATSVLAPARCSDTPLGVHLHRHCTYPRYPRSITGPCVFPSFAATGAIIVAGHYVLPEVTLFFSDKLYRGCRASKVDASRLAAFGSPNAEPIMKLGINVDVDWDNVFRSSKIAKFSIQEEMDPNVIVLRLFVSTPTPSSDGPRSRLLVQVVMRLGVNRSTRKAHVFLYLFGFQSNSFFFCCSGAYTSQCVLSIL